MSSFDDLKAEIESYPPVLTAGELIRIAERMGWRQARTQGSHCILEYTGGGYSHISIKAPGWGADQTRITTRNHLNEIFKPTLDQAQQEAEKMAALQNCMTQVDEILAECRSQFLTQAYLTLQKLETKARNCAKHYETQRLQECDQAIEQLLTERQQQHMLQVEAEATRAKQELAQVQQALQQVETELQTIAVRQDQQQQVLRQQHRRVVDQLHQQVRQQQHQIAQLETQLAAGTIAQQQTDELLALRTRLTRLQKRQQWRRIADLTALVLLGGLFVTSFHPAIGLADLFNLPQQPQQRQ